MSDLPHVPVLSDAEVADRPTAWAVESRERLARGGVAAFDRDVVRTPSGERIVRESVAHPGAVGVIAVDDADRVVVVEQYRHPAGFALIEPPAGLLDAAGESYAQAAARELAEEARLAADDWRVLVDLFTSPGASDESVRIFLARGLREVPRPVGFVLAGEEAHMTVRRVPLDALVRAILAGRVQNSLLVAGVLALAAARDDLDALRPADAPWLAREVRAERSRPEGDA